MQVFAKEEKFYPPVITWRHMCAPNILLTIIRFVRILLTIGNDGITSLEPAWKKPNI